MSCNYDRDILFFPLKTDTQANPWIFADSAQAWTITSKNSWILPSTFMPYCHYFISFRLAIVAKFRRNKYFVISFSISFVRNFVSGWALL
jgi:hypothetical protein